MTTQQISIFLESAKRLNFSLAAEHLFLSPSALSRQISLLESELNTRLFNRVNNIVTLTSAGELLQKELLDISGRIDQLRYLAASANRGLSGTLRIALSREMIVPPLLHQAIAAFHGAYPSIEIDLRAMEVGPMYEAVSSCAVDIGISARNNRDIDIYAQKLLAVPFSRETECLAIRREYVPDEMTEVTLDDCARLVRSYPLYMVSISCFNNPMKIYENDAFFMLKHKPLATPQRLFETLGEDRRMKDYCFVRDIDSVFLAVECGLGCTFTDTGSRLAHSKDVALLPIRFPEDTPAEAAEPAFYISPHNTNRPAENFLHQVRSML